MVDTREIFIYGNLKSPNDLQFYGKLLEAFDVIPLSNHSEGKIIYNMCVCRMLFDECTYI